MFDMKSYARFGAVARYKELAGEMQAIMKSFPGIERDIRADGSTTRQKASQPVGQRRTMSAKARKAISDAQKARWAKQKGEAKVAATGAKKKAGRKKQAPQSANA